MKVNWKSENPDDVMTIALKGGGILDRLDSFQIFRLEKDGMDIRITERCEDYFFAVLTLGEFRKLIGEMVEFAIEQEKKMKEKTKEGGGYGK